MNLSLNNQTAVRLTNALEENLRAVLPEVVGTINIDEAFITAELLQNMKAELENCEEDFIFRDNECLAITTYKNVEAFEKDVKSAQMTQFINMGIAKVHAPSMRVGLLICESDGRKLKELCARARAA